MFVYIISLGAPQKPPARKILSSHPKINVEFANGASATSIGTTELTVADGVKVEAHVFEDGVLSADLISVSQIVNEQNCDVLFTSKRVTVMDRTTKKKTIIGRKEK